MTLKILLRGSGDLSSGVALRLYRAGFQVLITELAEPLMVRRKVSFGEAVYTGEVVVEGVRAKRVDTYAEAEVLIADGGIPVMIDPAAEVCAVYKPHVVVDGRMIKYAREHDLPLGSVPLIIGMGPGFVVGENCDAVIETMRGHYLGRVFWQGTAQPDTGVPEAVASHESDRVLRAPVDGILTGHAEIGQPIAPGQVIADVDGIEMVAPFNGILRGLIHSGLQVTKGLKVGDLDPRSIKDYSERISDKALSIGGAVLEAILSRTELRPYLYS